jgi:hypothetical protein
MPDIKISQLAGVSSLNASDVFPISRSLGSGNWESYSITADNVLSSLASTRLLKVAKDGLRDADTIQDAISLAVALSPTESNPVAIQVFPGSYYENNPLNIPQWVTIYSEGGYFSAAVVANNNGNIFVSSGNSTINGFTILGLSTFSNVAYASTVAIDSDINNCIIIDCQTGILSNGGAVTANFVEGYSYTKVFGRFFSSINGGYIKATSCSITGITTRPIYGFYVSNANSEMYLFSCLIGNCVNGLYADNSGYIDCFSGHFEDCDNAVHIGSTGASHVRCVSTIIEDSTTYDLLIESPTSSLSYVGAFDSSKFSIVNGATISSAANDANNEGMLSLGKSTSWGTMNVGTPGAITLQKDINVQIGEGGSFINDQYGNPIVEFWSYDDTAPSGSKFTRFVNNAGTQLTGANDAIYVGCKYQFPAIRIDVNTVMSLVNPSDYLITEYWNGSAWTDLAPSGSPVGGGGVACYKRSDYTPRNHNLFKHVETEYVECSHVLYDNGDWSDGNDVLDQIPKWDANEPFYAIRFRNQQALANGMTFSDGRVKPHSFVFAFCGKQVNFGVYRTDRVLYIDSAALANDITNPASFTNIQISPNISYTDVPVFLKANAISRMSLAFVLPYDIDTSSPLYVYIDGTTVDATSGNVASTIYTSRIDISNPPLAFPLTEMETGPQITAVSGLANGFATISQAIDISGYNAEDTLFLSIARLANGGDDDYNGDFVVGDVTLKYKGKFV